MAAVDDDVIVVNEDVHAPQRVPGLRESVIALSDSDDSDEDVEVIQHGAAAAQGGSMCSMDCCDAPVPAGIVKRAVQDAASGHTLADMCATLVCPACGHALSFRDIQTAATSDASRTSTASTLLNKAVQLSVASLQCSGAVHAIGKLLRDAAPAAEPWLKDELFLAEASLDQIQGALRTLGLQDQGDRRSCIKQLVQQPRVQRVMPQIATTLGLMGTILHLRMLVLGRLPDEHFATDCSIRQGGAQAAASTTAAADVERPLYSLTHIGSSSAPVAPGRASKKDKKHKKRMAGAAGSGSGGSQSPSKKAKSGAKAGGGDAGASTSAGKITTTSAVAKGVGYSGSQHADNYASMLSVMHSSLLSKSKMHSIMGPTLGNTGPAAAAMQQLMPKQPGMDQATKVQDHMKRIQSHDERVRREKAGCLRAMLRLLTASCPSIVIGPMPAPLAIMLHGGLASVLHDLLEDSIDALLEDAEVQRPLLSLIEALTAHLLLLPALTARGGWPEHLLPPADRAAAAGGGCSSASASLGTSIADRLASMRAGCDLWQREGQKMLDDEDAAQATHASARDPADDIALVLHASSTGDRVRAALEASASYLEANAVQACADVPTEVATREPKPRKSKGNRESKAEARSAEQAAQDAMHAQHATALRQHAFFQAPLMDHAFRAQAQQVAHHSGSHTLRNKAIMKQLTSLSSSLPCHFDSSVHVAVSTERTDLARVLILAGSDTPYAYGAFVFDVFFPPNFPNVPPQMKFLTTGGGKVRFNPNLYQCGKVCLSLLGTWAGPSWSPATSTLLQVLVSLQAMVFCEHPYFNEPGYSRTAGTAAGDGLSASYNSTTRRSTLQHAILPCLKTSSGHPHGVFKDVLALHWRAKGALIKQYLKDNNVSSSHGELASLLEKLA